MVVEGVVKDKTVAKIEYSVSKEQGNTVMMANYSKSESSVLKVKIGNIEPKEKVTVKLQLIGSLTSEIPHQWTCRIPSHISPRYRTLNSLMEKIDKYLKNRKDMQLTENYLVTNV